MAGKKLIVSEPIKSNGVISSLEPNREIEVLKFESINIPRPYESIERSNDKYVRYGYDNFYPNYLLKLYNESPIHASILNSKANYIIGNGLKYTSGADINLKVNASDTFEEFSRKVVIDFLIFNFFCIEVIYNKFSQPIEYHLIPAWKIRTNKDKTKFWYFEDIINNDRRFILFDRYKSRSKDSISKIFFFDGYYPSINNTYPNPDYNHIILAIETDIAIRNFNLNNIRNHFSVSSIITFFRGSNITEEVKKKVLRELKESYTGEEGKKMIVDFQDIGGTPAKVENIDPNSWDKAYAEVSKKNSEDIFIGHQVTSPMLFGVKTEGQLGGATELETAYEIFKENYVRVKRNELRSAFNMLFSDSELIKGTVDFVDKQLFSARISDALKEKIYTINELRKEADLPPLPDGDKLLSIPKPIAIGASAQFYQQEQEPITEKINSITSLTEEDFNKIKDLGIIKEEFEIIEEGEFVKCKEDFNRIELLFEQDQEISDYIINNKIKNISIKDLQKALRKDLSITVSTTDLTNTVNTLGKSGIADITITEGNINVSPSTTPPVVIEVMYTYELRPDVPKVDKNNKPIISRPFCQKLIDNDRLYTRAEIQSMTAIFGYDIYKYGGGFYTSPEGITPYCRHEFKSKRVKRKNKK